MDCLLASRLACSLAFSYRLGPPTFGSSTQSGLNPLNGQLHQSLTAMPQTTLIWAILPVSLPQMILNNVRLTADTN